MNTSPPDIQISLVNTFLGAGKDDSEECDLDGGVLLEAVADAMFIANEAGLFRAAAFLFSEALLWGGGELSHVGILKQV